jgi:hypothetical protein
MRWEQPKPWHQRVVRRFLLFPRTIDYETRWFEFALIRQKYVECPYDKGFWLDIAWESE